MSTVDGQISPGLFVFLRDLRENNERAWFQEHRTRYERELRDPLLRLITEFAPLLEQLVSRHFVADPRPVGGSLFRIHRDTRFARDKSPYKTHAGLHFRHQAATRDVHAPGYYLHLEPDGCFAAAGIWHPPAETLQRIRRAIVDRPAAWGKVVADLGSVEGERLKRPPAGFPPDHPLIADLKLKDFLKSRALSEAEVCDPDFLPTLVESYRSFEPLMQFLTRAVGLSWSA